ncbi:MAG: hypothetical protein GYB55_23115 [Cytophagales bacterium]|nr:hypothetical protein [Cytophagales bacterium]
MGLPLSERGKACPNFNREGICQEPRSVAIIVSALQASSFSVWDTKTDAR